MRRAGQERGRGGINLDRLTGMVHPAPARSYNFVAANDVYGERSYGSTDCHCDPAEREKQSSVLGDRDAGLLRHSSSQ